jgi:hypothetical protein
MTSLNMRILFKRCSDVVKIRMVTVSTFAWIVGKISGELHSVARLGKKAPAITPAQLRLLLKTMLPLRVLDAEIIIELIDWIQQRNHRSSLSHRKKLQEKVDAERYVPL